MKKKKPHAEYWLGNIGNIKFSNDTFDLIKMASFRRGVQDFVRITTDKDIPVYYNIAGNAFTTGDIVVISAVIPNDEIDVVCGEACHEGTHIAIDNLKYFSLTYLKHQIPSFIFGQAHERYGFSHNETAKKIRTIINYIADRRIDKFQVMNSPGYRPYYVAMYNKYWYHSIIDDGIQSDRFREPTWKSYEFRIINLHNIHSRDHLDALPGLRDIAKIIDLSNIDRFGYTHQGTRKIYETALNVWNIITNHLDESTNVKKNKNSLNFEITNSMPGNDFIDTNLLEFQIKKQLKFLIHDTNKKQLTQEQSEFLTKLEESNITIKNGNYENQKVKTIVVSKLTNSMMGQFPCTSYTECASSVDAVNLGIRLGSILAKKLVIRNEESVIEYLRLNQGKLYTRHLHELASGNVNIFKNEYIGKYDPVIVHVSIDTSGSMRADDKWVKSLACSVAIAKAAEHIVNLDVIISFRTSIGDTPIPLVIIAYDSRVENFIKVRTVFGKIYPNGYTPEGLAYEAIMNLINESVQGKMGYFINISDGMPYFPCNEFLYNDISAIDHTRQQVLQMKKYMNVLSFFISSDENDFQRNDFQQMYGDSASFINIDEILSVAREMNLKLLKEE